MLSPFASAHLRVSCSITPPASKTAIGRFASYSIARTAPLKELTFFISQRVPNFPLPASITETLTSQRIDPVSYTHLDVYKRQGQGIGRWGNFFNVEAFGSNTTLPWGMTSPDIVSYLTYKQSALAAIGVTVDPNTPVHPCFLYESIWCLIGFVLLALYLKHRKFDGEVFLMYLAFYGAERSVVEGLRTDSLMIGSLRV